MNWGIFFCLAAVHLFCDFAIQFSYIMRLRYSRSLINRLKGTFLHAFVHYAVSVFAIGVLYSFSPITFVIIFPLSSLHGAIDYTKAHYISKKPHRKNSILLFSLDQFLHYCFLFVFAYLLSIFIIPQKITNYSLIEYLQRYLFTSLTSITYKEKYTLVIALMIAALWGVGIFIRIFLADLKGRTHGETDVEHKIKAIANNHTTPDGGFIIGIMERFFIICAIVLNMTQIIGFLLATKSIARFKKFDDDCFVENFIIGSFISFTAAIITGAIIKALHVINY